MQRSAVLACAIATISLFGCIDPADRRPGLWLSGEVVADPVQDWSFTAAHREIYVETRTPYWIRHSVTIVCADSGGELFIGARNPEEKRWVRWVARDPRVRLEIADRIYEVELQAIEDPDEIERVRAAYATKLGRPMEALGQGPAPDIAYWRVRSRS